MLTAVDSTASDVNDEADAKAIVVDDLVAYQPVEIVAGAEQQDAPQIKVVLDDDVQDRMEQDILQTSMFSPKMQYLVPDQGMEIYKRLLISYFLPVSLAISCCAIGNILWKDAAILIRNRKFSDQKPIFCRHFQPDSYHAVV